MYREALLLLAAGCALLHAQFYEGEPCATHTGAAGACAAFSRCPAAIDIIRAGGIPRTCSFAGRDPIICCPAGAAPRPPPLTPAPPRATSTEYVPTEAEYHFESEPTECPPIPPDRTQPKRGAKAWDKCIEYQELVYPCVSSAALALGDDRSRDNRCGHASTELVVGGVDAKEAEFPHMVMLGYGPELSGAQWLCGGTLVSEQFVITAGHCTFSREYGDVTFARTGALRRSQRVDPARTYPVAEIVKHPLYRAPGKYNDIALLKTQRKMTLDQYAVPACVDTGEARDEKALATGWGATQYKGANADVLQKVVLEKFSTQECRAKFPAGERNMREGFNATSQLCYGDHDMSRDTCQGDSGGPLQTYSRQMHCMYWLVGVTSFGKACGVVGSPGVYTRVAHFAPWIESIVWP